jgi:hypothetical protein
MGRINKKPRRSFDVPVWAKIKSYPIHRWRIGGFIILFNRRGKFAAGGNINNVPKYRNSTTQYVASRHIN